MPARPRIAISLGDPSGIGPEVTARALARRELRAQLEPVVYGDAGIWSRACHAVGAADRLPRIRPGQALPPGGALVEVSRLGPKAARPGRPDRPGARAQLAYLEAAVRAIEAGDCQALCTAPVSKAQVASAGLRFSGHTEFLARRFHRRVLMMLAGPRLRVALATTHLPLRRVCLALSVERLASDLALLSQALTHLGIARPHLAVCGVNPHAGEQGQLGDEERRVIRPAIAAARRRGVRAEGPFPADSLFPRAIDGGYDAVFAMYHDQGLVALKLLHFRDGVNVTLGLPFVRTSPDHGVAYDLAGTGSADATSMAQALRWAARPARAAVSRRRTAGDRLANSP